MGHVTALWLTRVTAFASLAAAVWLLVAPAAPPALNADTPRSSPSIPAGQSARPDTLARLIVRRNPFRVHRSAALVRYGISQDPETQAARPPRPPFVLVGLVLGLDTAALIDGFPGIEGTRLVQLGDRIGEYVLRSVDSDRAIIAGPDTTWTLNVRRHP